VIRLAQIGCASILVCTSFSAFAKERTLKKEEVPQVVLDAAMAKYPNAELKIFAEDKEKKQIHYEVQLDVAGQVVELVMNADGSLITEEKIIQMDALPDAVKKSFAQSKYAMAAVEKIERAEHAKNPAAPVFELVVNHKGKKYELFFSHLGKLTKTATVKND
jgi:hypothetical protein